MPPAADPTTWAALPAATRTEVLRLAAHGKAHPDPAVAAATVAATRSARLLGRRHLRVTVWLTAVGWGAAAAALFLLGGSIHDAGAADAPIIISAVLGVTAFFAGAGLSGLLLRRHHNPPETAETPNLRALIQQTPTPAWPEPHTIRRHFGTLPVVLAAAPIAAPLGYLLARHTGRPLEPTRAVPALLLSALAYAALHLIDSAIRRRRAGRRRAPMPIRLTDDGIRFGRFRRPVPWHDVLGIHLTGQAIEWTLRNQPKHVLAYDDTRTPPEEIVLTARAYHARLGTQPANASSRSA
ncbi:MAG: hypothetical protein HOV71_27505 [Hamadaea sp.]|nr:hypothetical protein [Hamadaea sp.]